MGSDLLLDLVSLVLNFARMATASASKNTRRLAAQNCVKIVLKPHTRPNSPESAMMLSSLILTGRVHGDGVTNLTAMFPRFAGG